MSEMYYSSDISVCDKCHTKGEKTQLKDGSSRESALKDVAKMQNILPTDEKEFFDWVDSADFVSYLIQNKHICPMSVAAIPHDGSHGLCACCQVNDIIRNIFQNKEELISALHRSPAKTVIEDYLNKYVGKPYID